jgi:hypothetical protein
VLPAPVHDGNPEDEVAQRAVVGVAGGAARARQAGGDRAAQRRAAAEMRRFEGEHLALVSQHGLEFGQRRAATRGHDQFGRFVFDDAGVRTRVERGRGREGPAVERLAAAADDGERRPRGARGTDRVAHRGDGRLGGHARPAMQASYRCRLTAPRWRD